MKRDERVDIAAERQAEDGGPDDCAHCVAGAHARAMTRSMSVESNRSPSLS
jgi:hypothetical protein